MSVILYPPKINSYLPASLYNERYKINFSISDFNASTDIKYVELKVVNQYTNQTVLKTSKYPSESIFYPFSSIKKQQEEKIEQYYLYLYPNDLVDNKFVINQYYKVQLRLISIEAGNIISSNIQGWIQDNKEYFSQWSSVGLIRGISTINFNNLNIVNNKEIGTEIFNVYGSLSFSNNQEQDVLEQYQLTLKKMIKDAEDKPLYAEIYDQSKKISLAFDSNKIINYSFKKALENNSEYICQLKYKTKAGYEGIFVVQKLTTNFSSDDSFLPAGDLSLSRIQDSGSIAIDIVTEETDENKNFIVKRASEIDGFKTWQTIHQIALDKTISKYNYIDKTPENYISYIYALQQVRVNEAGRAIYSKLLINNNQISINTDETILYTPDYLLKLLYNVNLTNYKYNVSENTSTTLGSKYPYIRRQGNIYYRTFNLTGLLGLQFDSSDIMLPLDDSCAQNTVTEDPVESDIKPNKQHGVFAEDTEEDLIHNNYKFRDSLDKQFYDQFTYRNKIIDFLYENNVKLFKSKTEGNMLVKITNVNLTPKKQIGRMLYEFSATLTEIAEYSIDNLYKYNFLQNKDLIIPIHEDKTNLLGYGVLGTMKLSGDNLGGGLK